ncbi:methyltransferase regulatory domain-containing protein [Aquincola sp. S2]|uniref:Methyltransferase regulatory domain-containing protein n=1 Tax=Pseudaquabacterium terrae TaxID=2732868 RepID=A0ABX2EH85_9BURK|nr:methyltransferase regulatory domain-containing protein [Aquabacterium terrae]NRF67984.1 methyltransferase regulatory domain-containing protein [Aquabacterium terrae]
MNDWTAGYVADIGYTFGYYPELNPLRMKLAFLHAGLVCPEVGTACELGFGQGMSTNLHAAATTVQWHGTDFNPAQAAFAQELAAAGGAGARLFDESFAEFASRTDLPDFDFIALHGIWSWISDENRACIVDFVRRKLKVGGVLYVSYNTLPGWAAFAPMRHLLTQHAEIIGSEGRGIASRIDGALAFAEKLLEQKPGYAIANPHIGERLQQLKAKPRHYLAHEYFNRDWHPMHFATMVDWLAPAKVSYACPAHLIDHVPELQLTEGQQAFLKEIPDFNFRESVRDFMTHQQFRRDYWVKGPRMLSALGRTEALRSQRLMLTTHRPHVTLKVSGALGEARLNEALYGPLLDAMAEHQPRSVAELERLPQLKMPFAALMQCLVVLCGSGHVWPAQTDAQADAARPATDRLNQALLRRSRDNGDIAFLASPVTGGGAAVARIPQLCLLARQQGLKTPEEWARFALELMLALNQRVVKDGKTLDRPEDTFNELVGQARMFAEQDLPTLQALRIA